VLTSQQNSDTLHLSKQGKPSREYSVMSDLSSKVHSSERDAGRRATYHVYYRRNGKLFYDPSWLETPDAAGAAVVKMVKQAYRRATVELVKVVSVTPTFP
jgi:hypothetical protein